MVDLKTYRLFLAFIVFAIAYIVLLPFVHSCHLEPLTVYDQGHPNELCGYDCDCVGGNTYDLYDWFGDSSGNCETGCYAGQYWYCFCNITHHCQCDYDGPEARWRPINNCDNGDTCKVRWGRTCPDESTFQGKWDASEGKCVACSGNKQIKAVKCGEDDDYSERCESACGASDNCDEKQPDSFNPIGWGEVYCDSNCQAFVCDSSHMCSRLTVNGITYYCNGWQWTSYKPSGCCYSDNDCSGYDPNTHTRLVCDCPDSGCSKHENNNYRCVAKGYCSDNSDCDPNYCCAADPNGPGGSGVCVGKGIYSDNPRYLCDPPYGFVTTEDKNPIGVTTKDQNTSVNLIDALINFFSNLF